MRFPRGLKPLHLFIKDLAVNCITLSMALESYYKRVIDIAS